MAEEHTRVEAVLHQSEAIHPFLDGNGRVGRLLLSLLLVEWELLSLPLLYLSAFFYRRRHDYYDLLFAVSERGPWVKWISFFLQGITEQADDAILRVKRLQDLQAGWREKLTQARASALLLRLADHLFTAPVITIPEAQEILDVTYPTAQRYIARLESAGIISQVGESGYGKTFVANEILEAIGTGDR